MLSIFKGIFSNDDTALKEVLVKNNPQLIDVRTPLEFNGGTVKGAKNIPLSELESKLGSLDNQRLLLSSVKVAIEVVKQCVYFKIKVLKRYIMVVAGVH